MPTQHAILAPSAAKRWMTCPPSARLEAQVPSKDTAYTREGTIAHAMAETILRICLGMDRFVGEDWADKFHTAWNTLQPGTKMAPLMMELGSHVDEALDEELDPWEMMETVLVCLCIKEFL